MIFVLTFNYLVLMTISYSLFIIRDRLLLTGLNVPVLVQIISITYASTLYLRIALSS
jgi:hypothetical protein